MVKLTSYILLLSMLALQISAETDTMTPEMKISTVSFNSEKLGMALGAIWRVTILVCLALLLIDTVYRFQGKKLFHVGVSHVSRFIWWIYGTAGVYIVGSSVPFGYRGFNQDIYGQFFSETYAAYFRSGWLNIFTNKITTGINNQPEGHQHLVENAIFIELIIIIVLRIAGLVSCCWLKTGGRWAHLIQTLRRNFMVFLGMYFIWYSIMNYKYVKNIRKQTNVQGLRHFNLGLSLVCSIYVQLEILFSFIEFIYYSVKGGASAIDDKKKGYQQTANPGVQIVSDKKSKKDLIKRTYDAFYDEVSFMYMDRAVVFKSFWSRYYNLHWFFRWAVFFVIGIAAEGKPRSIYVFYFVYDFLHCLYTLWVIISFRKPAGLLIMISEVLVYFRHISQFANFIDQGNGSKMRQGAVDFWTHISFWSYILGTFIELALIIEPMFNVTKDAEPEQVQPAGITPSQELDDLGNDDDFERRTKTINTMKAEKNNNNKKAEKDVQDSDKKKETYQ